ncbi:Hypothetical protein Rta_01680 [Ramlibacter tataouinensis TTB310]|uniref:PIN domain-containing protein n=1 Tax=Ramlibacter tataouinensis (strain ATCC BAA-407 / DSM 14655 / LMG 21543 / TTB310) TaxID=365046 RepID=F5Y3V4_RAMTT|nr:Hypothetical protein Rta_01680 [Ramlibacter tataouinensis TTB310]
MVADCSLVAGTLFSEPWQEQADLQLMGRELHAPFLLQCEIANVALKKTRQGSADLVAEGLQRLREMAIRFHRIEEAATVDLAQRYRLSAYDAAYLWLAADLKCPLATFDDRLAEAARVHLASLE